MSLAYYHLYERQIKRKAYTKEHITEIVDNAHTKGRLTDDEYTQLVALIDQYYDEPESNVTETTGS